MGGRSGDACVSGRPPVCATGRAGPCTASVPSPEPAGCLLAGPASPSSAREECPRPRPCGGDPPPCHKSRDCPHSGCSGNNRGRTG
eukprot:57001-Prymnesium_polylepis.1